MAESPEVAVPTTVAEYLGVAEPTAVAVAATASTLVMISAPDPGAEAGPAL